jgi:hypothetical protein
VCVVHGLTGDKQASVKRSERQLQSQLIIDVRTQLASLSGALDHATRSLATDPHKFCTIFCKSAVAIGGSYEHLNDRCPGWRRRIIPQGSVERDEIVAK